MKELFVNVRWCSMDARKKIIYYVWFHGLQFLFLREHCRRRPLHSLWIYNLSQFLAFVRHHHHHSRCALQEYGGCCLWWQTFFAKEYFISHKERGRANKKLLLAKMHLQFPASQLKTETSEETFCRKVFKNANLYSFHFSILSLCSRQRRKKELVSSRHNHHSAFCS